jgi:hypothetical protein
MIRKSVLLRAVLASVCALCVLALGCSQAHRAIPVAEDQPILSLSASDCYGAVAFGGGQAQALARAARLNDNTMAAVASVAP